MALHRCPDCHNKISESAKQCLHCGFSFLEADLAVYKQKLEQRRLANHATNQKNVKVQLTWLAIFAVIIGVGIWLNQ